MSMARSAAKQGLAWIAAGVCLACLTCMLAIGMSLQVWVHNGRREGVTFTTAHNPDILPWYWTATETSGGRGLSSDYLCLVDIQATFLPLEGTEVLVYMPHEPFMWQCPRGTITGITQPRLTHLRDEQQRTQEAAEAESVLRRKARELTWQQ